MKKTLYLAALLVSLSATAANPPEINEKVMKAFNETFSTAVNVSWVEMEEKCQVDFHVSEVKIRATYDNDGNLLKTTRWYEDEKNLPVNILAKLKMKYAGKKLTGVTEIITESEVSYQLVLKDETHWYWVEATPYGALTLTQKLKRGDPKETAAF